MEALKDGFRVRVVLHVDEDAVTYGKLNGSNKVYEYLKGMHSYDREHFIVIALGAKLEVNAIATVSIGILNASIVHPREVFKVPILANACGVIFAHNHPSGDPTPSSEDLNMTRRLVECGELLGIPVLDHLIIGDEETGYLSMADEQLAAFGNQNSILGTVGA